MEFLPLLLLLLIIVVFALIGRSLEEAANEKRQKVLKQIHREAHGFDKNCPPHKWAYHPASQRLTCTLCNHVAGSDHNPRGGDSPY
jgi:hypothetical protein